MKTLSNDTSTGLSPAPHLVTYTMEFEGRMVVVENVPAYLDPITQEPFFELATIAKIQEVVRRQPVRYIEAAVYSFAA